MKALFVHDHKFIKYNDKIYSTGSFPKAMWARYLSHFESITVVGRKSKEPFDINNSLTLSSHSKVKFILISEEKSIIGKFTNALKVILKRELSNCDCLIARLPSQYGLVACKHAVKYNVVYAVEVVGCGFDALWNHGSFLGKIYAYLFYRKLKKVILNADGALYVTKFFLQKRYPCEGLTGNASNVELPSTDFNYVLQNQSINHSLIAEDERELVIGIIGHLNASYKGIDTAIHTIYLLQKQLFRPIRLEIVGGGDSSGLNKLSKKLGVSDRVSFIGLLPHGEELFDWLDSIQFYIQPSKTEGLPRSLIEAMGRGCLCAATNVGGIPELLPNQYLHKPNDPFGLLTIIKTFINQTQESLEDISRRNFIESMKYTKAKLDQDRSRFWVKFIKEHL